MHHKHPGRSRLLQTQPLDIDRGDRSFPWSWKSSLWPGKHWVFILLRVRFSAGVQRVDCAALVGYRANSVVGFPICGQSRLSGWWPRDLGTPKEWLSLRGRRAIRARYCPSRKPATVQSQLQPAKLRVATVVRRVSFSTLGSDYSYSQLNLNLAWFGVPI